MYLEEELASQISSETHFGSEVKSMYYYVREPNKGASGNPTEGYAKKMVLESELNEGQICIDGHLKYDVNYGDHVSIDSMPEHRLKCIKFIM